MYTQKNKILSYQVRKQKKHPRDIYIIYMGKEKKEKNLWIQENAKRNTSKDHKI